MALTTAVIFISCSDNKKDTQQATATSSETPKPRSVPEVRDTIQRTPVASYSERTDNPLNEWYFKVQLFETKRTFKYLMKLQFEEIRGEDTLTIPNLGVMPEPVIQKGPDPYSCIIGFKDQDGKFRDYKKVYVRNNTLKVTALKHYAVTTR